ncbi:MAG: carboxypeptidase-like regulatory domain-containing protein [Bacteroidaceae bacterium]|nr:carboxypeptidase-like regulatory domain-containing protein [Bacteroidaceae bacterium]
MKRIILSIFVCLLCLTGWAQQTVSAHVVDSETGEALPYVNIYISSENGTMCNVDGNFSISAMPTDTLRISRIGYETLLIVANKVHEVVKLDPIENMMNEVTVSGYKDLLGNIVGKLEEEYRTRKSEQSQYFMRQTNYVDGGWQMVESFIQAHSAIDLRNLVFLSGRHFKEHGNVKFTDESTDMLWFSNLHKALSLAPMVKGDGLFWAETTVIPFNTAPGSVKGYSYKKKYETSTSVLRSEEGQEILKITMKESNNKKKDVMLCGVLYVDAKTLDLLSFDGHLENFSMKVWSGLASKTVSAQLNIHIAYNRQKGFSQISNIATSLRCNDIVCQTILYNIDGMNIPIDGKRVGSDNMLVAIERAGYDPNLWTSDIVQRTQEEEKLVIQNGSTKSASSIDLGQVSDPSMNRLISNLQSYSKSAPQEKVYVHMDNTCYFLGDTIYYKAYLRRTDTDSPSEISGLLYVDILNNDGFLMERQKIQMAHGEGNGSFVLKTDSSMYSGFYELRAYTLWQLNWGAYEREHRKVNDYWFYNKEMANEYFRDYDKLYSRVFPVYDRPQKAGEFERDMTLRRLMRYYSAESEEPKAQVTFYPEGGNLVTGLPCRVAFEASTQEGEYLSGELRVDGQSILTGQRGRGVFTITPEAGKVYRATFHDKKGNVVEAKLPQAEKEGVSLHLRMLPDSCLITLRKQSLPQGNALGMTIMHEGNALYFTSLEQDETCLAIPLSKLATGVNQVTIFDSDGRVWADRLFFVLPHEGFHPTINFTGQKEEYVPYEKISLKISSQKSDFPGTVSVSVRDGYNSCQLFDNGNIMTEMLLSSEIKGFIPNPGWFFEKDDDEHLHELDLLMMVQGWRRFVWKDMSAQSDFTPQFVAEKELKIAGHVLPYHSYHRENSIEYQQVMDFLFDKNPSESHAKVSGHMDAADLYKSPHANETFKTNNSHDEALLEKGTGDGQEGTREYMMQILSDDYGLRSEGDRTYRGDGLKSPKNQIRVHSEFIYGKKAVANDTITKDGYFEASVPHFTGKCIMHLSASDTTRWKDNDKHQWIFPNEEEYPEYYVKLRQLNPHFSRPYTYYQTHRPTQTSDKPIDGQLQSEVHTLQQICVRARHGGLIKRMYVGPAIKMDAYDAFNLAVDAGLIDGWMPGATNFSNAVAHAFIGDMGVDNNYQVTILPYKSRWATAPAILASDMGIRTGEITDDNSYNSDAEGLEYNQLSSLDSVYIYTDYSPRMEGDSKYRQPNQPIVAIYLKKMQNNEKRITYRDRFLKLPGYSVAEDFYSPDYSKQTPPEPTDYRRTLYWNPNLQLDENGQARITLYNNSRTTQISVEAEGQASDGTLLWSK